MKLPENKKERLKVLMCIILGAAIVIWLIVIGVITPYSENKQMRIEKIAKLQDDLTKANTDINLAPKTREKNNETILKINAISDKYVLLPRLGENYLLGARDIVDNLATELGLEIEAVSEIGRGDIPKTSGQNTLRAYTARFTLQCGYYDFVQLIGSIEKNNPYACIADINISAQPATREKHKIIFSVQWPIWEDIGMSDKLKEQLAEDGTEINGKNGKQSSTKKSKATDLPKAHPRSLPADTAPLTEKGRKQL